MDPSAKIIFIGPCIAKKAEVKKLIIGHFSARYADYQPLLLEAKSIFANTLLAEEFKTYPF